MLGLPVVDADDPGDNDDHPRQMMLKECGHDAHAGQILDFQPIVGVPSVGK
jgi:hypothetical protein